MSEEAVTSFELSHLVAVLNISTSAQLAIRMNPNFVPPMMDVTSSIEYFPYFDGHYLAVAASLTGGNVMFAFVKMLQQWTHELGRCCHMVDSNALSTVDM